MSNNSELDVTTKGYSIYKQDQQKAFEHLSLMSKGILPNKWPFQLQVDLTDMCNFHILPDPPPDCKGCSFPQKLKGKTVDVTQLESVLKRFEDGGGKSVLLTGGGEPGMYKRDEFERVLFFLKTSHLSVDINTNGLLARLFNRVTNHSEYLLEKVYSYDKQRSTISFSVHNNEAYEALQFIDDLRKKRTLNIRLRTTFLVHNNTTPSDVDNFISKSRKYGADVANLKPFHGFKGGFRRYQRNQAVYDHVQGLLNSHLDFGLSVGAMRLDRLKDDFKHVENKIIETVNSKPEKMVRIDPVLAIYLNSSLKAAVNCDVKAVGVGNTFPALFSIVKKFSPKEYYINALKSVIICDEKIFLIGDNFMEINSKAEEEFQPLIALLRNLRTKFKTESGFVEEDVEKKLKEYFQCLDGSDGKGTDKIIL